MEKLLAFALPKFTLITLMVKKPILLVPVIPVVTATTIVVDFKSMCNILLVFFISDFLSGLGASYCRWRKSDHKDRWFFGKGEGFSSDKAKKMGLKALIYIFVPLGLIQIQKVTHLKNFKYESVSDAEFELATVAVIIFCLIEGFSIFHENLPDCGFNLWGSVKKILGFAKEVKKEIID